MVKNILIGFVVFAGLASSASPVKSMLATDFTRIVEADGTVLPDGIVAVEYIESTGTQAIDTGYKFNPLTDVIYCEAAYVVLGSYSCLFGSQYSTILYSVRQAGSTSKYQFQPQVYFAESPLININEFQTIVYRSTALGNCMVDGKSSVYSFPSTQDESPYSFCIFACKISLDGFGLYSKAKVRRYIHYRELNKIIDLIPVRVEDDYGNDFGAMYDLVSGELFLNRGTGDFIIGPDL